MKKYHNHYYNKNLLEYARELRSEKATKAERRIWKSLLCKNRSDIRFLRQRSIDWFILDFFSPELDLIIEIDGNSHYHKPEYDAYRQERLQQMGYAVIRFSEGEILNQLDLVHERIIYVIHCLKRNY